MKDDLKLKQENGKYKIETGPLDYDAAMRRKREMEQAGQNIEARGEFLFRVTVILIICGCIIAGYFIGINL